MKKLVFLVIVALACGFALAQSSATVPFTIELSESASSEFPGAPRLQSFSFAQWKGRWVFVGGRIGGYHAVGGGSAEFLPADANRDVWVVDTNVQPARTYHANVAQMPESLAPVRAQWTATGHLFFQDNDKLYISGGYGQDEKGKWTTFDVISQVSLPELVEAVIHGRLPSAGIAFARSPLVKSAGGGLTKLPDGFFYIVMGHTFQGSYTVFEGQEEHNSGEASQTYLNEIRKLSIKTKVDGSLSVVLAGRFRDEAEFHRRDLNITPMLSRAGLGFAAYGGVFTPETQLSYSKPIYVGAGSRPDVDSGFEQKMNAYSCAVLVMYNTAATTMYTTFFGGISRFSWNPLRQVFEENPKVGSKTDSTYLDGLQWSDQISTIRKRENETFEIVHPASLPAFVGAGAVFIPSPDLARARPGTDILSFEPLQGTRTFVGYIYGGIRAYPYRFPYLKTAPRYNAGAVPTKISDLILKVYVRGEN
jgi:hypothetical protein